MSIAMVMFVVSLLAVGGAYLWKSYLSSAQTTYRTELATREKQFNLDLIQQLQDQSEKLNLAKRVLYGHIAASQIFSIIGALTAEHVRFTSLDFTAPGPAATDAKIALSGYGASLSTVAFQSDVLGTLGQYGLRNIVKNPILSNPALDANGTVAFSLSASVDPSALSYEKGTASPAGRSASASSTLSNP